MRTILAGLVLLVSCAAAGAKDLVYEGTWATTNRKLDGTMTCVVTDLGDNRWHGHFSGVWSGQRFSYEVDFSGPADRLRGQAVIDGADYEWAGEMGQGSPGSFKGTFWGSRYTGHFNLKQKGG
jgi:hypothetical protein